MKRRAPGGVLTTTSAAWHVTTGAAYDLDGRPTQPPVSTSRSTGRLCFPGRSTSLLEAFARRNSQVMERGYDALLLQGGADPLGAVEFGLEERATEGWDRRFPFP